MGKRRGQLAELGLHLRRLRVDEDHAVRVADGHADDPQAQARNRDLLPYHLTRGAGDADVGAEERELPHVHRDARALGVQHVGRHAGRRASGCRSPGRAGRPAVPQVAREDAQPVAALLELAAVRVEQAQGERSERSLAATLDG